MVCRVRSTLNLLAGAVVCSIPKTRVTVGIKAVNQTTGNEGQMRSRIYQCPGSLSASSVFYCDDTGSQESGARSTNADLPSHPHFAGVTGFKKWI